MERSIGTLLNAGVEKEHPAIQKGIQALITPERVSGKEHNYRKRTAAKCDLTYALLRSVWNVID